MNMVYLSIYLLFLLFLSTMIYRSILILDVIEKHAEK